MRRVREFVFLLAILSLAVVPMIGAGCNDQSASAPPAASNDATKKPATTKPSKKKAHPSAESGSTTGDLGVKPPKAPDANK